MNSREERGDHRGRDPVLRLAALVDGPTHVCCRYRVSAFRSAFSAAAYALDLHPWPSRWWSRIALFRRLSHADVVLLQRKLLQSWQLRLLRSNSKTLIFDFDDAVFLRDSHSKKGRHSGSRLRRFKDTIRAADMVVAGNDYLAKQSRQFTSAAKVTCIPTCVDLDRYPEAEHERVGAGVVLTWIGSASTLQGLDSLRPILEEAGRRQPGLIFKLICDRFFSMQYMGVQACAWTEATEAHNLASADIGVSWLPDDDWSRGKCGLKILQYMAAGLPVIANPVGVQAALVRHEETGLLASTPEEWGRAIGRLARYPELRREMGRRGRERVRGHFSVSAGSSRWFALLSQIRGRQAA